MATLTLFRVLSLRTLTVALLCAACKFECRYSSRDRTLHFGPPHRPVPRMCASRTHSRGARARGTTMASALVESRERERGGKADTARAVMAKIVLNRLANRGRRPHHRRPHRPRPHRRHPRLRCPHARMFAARVAAATPRVVAARLAGGRSLLLRDDLARELVRLRAAGWSRSPPWRAR